MFKSIFVAALLSLAVTFNLAAQTAQGVITGSVTDGTGAGVPNAEVLLLNQGTQVQQKTNAESNGTYRFSLVPPGVYTVTIRAAGFTDREVKDVTVDASTTVPVNATLSIKTATTSVEVTEAVTLVQTASSDLSTTVDQKFITSMPLLTRNVFDLAFAAPSVTQGMNLQAASGGSRESGTTYLLNGADNNNNFSEGGVNIQPPLESVS
jgi:hypothetical protein